MKYFWLCTLIAFLGSITPNNSYALTTETRNNQNSDGSSKFEDPDEQVPKFMITPDRSALMNGDSPQGFPLVTAPQPNEMTPGARAFDRAFSHLSQSNQ